MIFQDKTYKCNECSTDFAVTAKLQQALFKINSTSVTRCPKCHAEATCISRNAGSSSAPINEETEQNTQFELKKVDAVNISSFSDFGLDNRLVKAVLDAGYDIPTEIQCSTLPVALKGRDIIATAQTGTGKTAAFVLPILQRLLSNPSKKPVTRALVITPTRELAEQVSDSFRTLAKYTKLSVSAVYGGVGPIPQENALRRGCHIIVACPGRLLDHVDHGNTHFQQVDVLALDEADRMLDMGFLPSVKRIISYLPKQRQTMLFSATFAPELAELVKDALIDPLTIDIGLRTPAKTVAHALYPCSQHLKTSLLLTLLNKIDSKSVLIFTRTKHRANRLSEHLEKAGHQSGA